MSAPLPPTTKKRRKYAAQTAARIAERNARIERERREAAEREARERAAAEERARAEAEAKEREEEMARAVRRVQREAAEVGDLARLRAATSYAKLALVGAERVVQEVWPERQPQPLTVAVVAILIGGASRGRL